MGGNNTGNRQRIVADTSFVINATQGQVGYVRGRGAHQEKTVRDSWMALSYVSACCDVFFTPATREELLAVAFNGRAIPTEMMEQAGSYIGAFLGGNNVHTIEPAKQNGANCNSDPNDNIIVEAAVGGGAHCLITGDRDLISLRRIGECRILYPDQYLRDEVPDAAQSLLRNYWQQLSSRRPSIVVQEQKPGGVGSTRPNISVVKGVHQQTAPSHVTIATNKTRGLNKA